MALERIPNQVGYLVLNEDGAVLSSGGELENDERIATLITGLVTMSDKIDSKAFPNDERFDTISISYPNHCYIICLSNKKIHVVKRKTTGPTISSSSDPESLIDV